MQWSFLYNWIPSHSILVIRDSRTYTLSTGYYHHCLNQIHTEDVHVQNKKNHTYHGRKYFRNFVQLVPCVYCTTYVAPTTTTENRRRKGSRVGTSNAKVAGFVASFVGGGSKELKHSAYLGFLKSQGRSGLAIDLDHWSLMRFEICERGVKKIK